MGRNIDEHHPKDYNYKDGSFQHAMYDDTGKGNQPKNDGLWLMISLVHGLNEDFPWKANLLELAMEA
jgi:hypothetical protein